MPKSSRDTITGVWTNFQTGSGAVFLTNSVGATNTGLINPAGNSRKAKGSFVWDINNNLAVDPDEPLIGGYVLKITRGIKPNGTWVVNERSGKGVIKSGKKTIGTIVIKNKSFLADQTPYPDLSASENGILDPNNPLEQILADQGRTDALDVLSQIDGILNTWGIPT